MRSRRAGSSLERSGGEAGNEPLLHAQVNMMMGKMAMSLRMERLRGALGWLCGVGRCLVGAVGRRLLGCLQRTDGGLNLPVALADELLVGVCLPLLAQRAFIQDVVTTALN